jgi:hypothetical protein
MARIFIMACLLVALVGCKRQESAAPAPPPTADQAPSQANPPGPPKEAITEPVAVGDAANMDATLAQLSDELRAYVGRTRSRPKDFADFAQQDHLQYPAPPSGKAYAIAHGKVVLVSQ